MKISFLSFLFVILLAAACGAWYLFRSTARPAAEPSLHKIALVSYVCDARKTIAASFYESSSTLAVQPGQPPKPTGSVALSLGDGRTTILPQTMSADGARYANADETFVFWTKGEGAFISENGSQTYTNCAETLSQ